MAAPWRMTGEIVRRIIILGVWLGPSWQAFVIMGSKPRPRMSCVRAKDATEGSTAPTGEGLEEGHDDQQGSGNNTSEGQDDRQGSGHRISADWPALGVGFVLFMLLLGEVGLISLL